MLCCINIVYSNHLANTWISWSCPFQHHRRRTFYCNYKPLQCLWQEVANLVTVSARLSTRMASTLQVAQNKCTDLSLSPTIIAQTLIYSSFGPPHYPLCKGKSPHVAQWSFVHEFTAVATAGDKTEFKQCHSQHFEDKSDKFQVCSRSRVAAPRGMPSRRKWDVVQYSKTTQNASD